MVVLVLYDELIYAYEQHKGSGKEAQRAAGGPRCPAGHHLGPNGPMALGDHDFSKNECDVCGATGTEQRCTGGCDFDLCARCYAEYADLCARC